MSISCRATFLKIFLVLSSIKQVGIPSWLAAAYFSLIFCVFRVLHEHIQRLSKVVTANHKALQIPEVTSPFLFFCMCVGVWTGIGMGRRLFCFTLRRVALLSVTAEISCRKNTLYPCVFHLPSTFIFLLAIRVTKSRLVGSGGLSEAACLQLPSSQFTREVWVFTKLLVRKRAPTALPSSGTGFWASHVEE